MFNVIKQPTNWWQKLLIVVTVWGMFLTSLYFYKYFKEVKFEQNVKTAIYDLDLLVEKKTVIVNNKEVCITDVKNYTGLEQIEFNYKKGPCNLTK